MFGIAKNTFFGRSFVFHIWLITNHQSELLNQEHSDEGITKHKEVPKEQIDNMKAKSVEYLANFIKERKIGKIKLTLIKNYNIHILEDKVILSHVSK